MYTVQNTSDFHSLVSSNTDIQNAFKNDPVLASKNISIDSPVPDTLVYRIVVGSLGLSVIFVIIGVIILSVGTSGGDKNIPTVLTAISSGAIGALAGLLAPSPTGTKNSGN